MPLPFSPPRFLPGFALLLACVLLGGGSTVAEAETTSASGATAITSLPYPIVNPGTYYLAANLTVSNQTAITISASNVTLDLNGHTLTDSSGLASASNGINITGANVSVVNGQLCGFAYGVYTSGPHTRLENLATVNASYIGLYVAAANAVVKGCRLVNTGGGTGVADTSAYGIVASANNARLIDCDVLGLAPRQGGQSIGIVCFGENGQLVGNRIANGTYGVYMAAASTKFRDNLCVSSTYAAYVGAGTDAGNNN